MTTYIENVYICLAAPILIAAIGLRSRRKMHMIFLLAGMSACLLSSYITTWMAALVGVGSEYAVTEVAPFVEEVVKFSPILFCLIVASPPRERVPEYVLMISVGFATLENVCYLLTNGSQNLIRLLIRGFGTGAMHVVCGAMVSAGLIWLWKNQWLQIIGTVGLISVAITYHGVFNILVTRTGAFLVIGCIIPVFTMGLFLLSRRLRGSDASVYNNENVI
ncbi:MAG: PrsW family intramembrane metalloprotease [Lachnospiraceae bacterium]|nr:PrsW family intramembrane metalloprotease [Lachnospiraceae bacterium]